MALDFSHRLQLEGQILSAKHISRILPLLLLGTALLAQEVQVRINNHLSSASAEPGTTFDGSLVNAVSLAGRACPKGSSVAGRVTDSKSSGRLSSPGVLELEINSIQCSGRNYSVSAEPLRIEGRSHTKRNATLIGGGAAAGAVLGGLLGGGKGALIGAGAGAGAGTVGAAATGKKEAEVESEAIVAWNLTSVAEAQVPRRERYRDHDRDGDRDAYDRRDDHRRGNYNDRRHEDDYMVFNERQRSIIRACVNSGRSGLPPGLAKKDRLPPGLEKHIQRDGTLPPGLQKRVQPLPYACSDELPNLPGGWDRVILSGRILLLNRERRIIDLFFLAG
jgi:hypothetical protein